MPTNDPIAAARREAKSRSRTGGITHQQALDQVAREAGHEHWSAMLAGRPSRGPAVFLPPLLDEFRFLPGPESEDAAMVEMRALEDEVRRRLGRGDRVEITHSVENGMLVLRVEQRDHRVTIRQRGTSEYGIRSGFGPEGGAESDETVWMVGAAMSRVVEIATEFETTEPAKLAEIKRRYEAEVAYNARKMGTDAEGWGWWIGPNEDEYTWGGPYRLRRDAVSDGNGSCSDVGEIFHIVQARTDGEGPDEDGMVRFEETRSAATVRAT